MEGFRDLGRRTRKKERQNDTAAAAQKGAIAAAKAREQLAIVDRTVMIGGVSFHAGKIQAKRLVMPSFAGLFNGIESCLRG
jgi:hypothetical protein